MELLKRWPWLGSVFLLLAVLLLLLRMWQVVVPMRLKVTISSYSQLNIHQSASKRTKPLRLVRVMAVLGSGGHTTELLKLMKRLNRDVYPSIIFVLAETDKTSKNRTRLDYNFREASDSFAIIPRSREVGQSWSSSVWTTLRAVYSCLRLVYNCRPQLVLCNGPGTCIPICAAVLLFRILGVESDSKIIFCESFARVQHLSLTGKLLYYIADEFVVQWPQLQTKYPRTKHLGVIC